MMDLYLFACYAVVAVWATLFNKSISTIAALSLGGATVTFVVATAMMGLGIEHHWFHMTISAICIYWSYLSVKIGSALWVAIAVMAMGVFQVMLSLDGFMYPATETEFSVRAPSIALIFHLLIILATIANGTSLYVDPKRRTASARPPL